MNVNSDCEVIDIKQIYFIFILVKNWSELFFKGFFFRLKRDIRNYTINYFFAQQTFVLNLNIET